MEPDSPRIVNLKLRPAAAPGPIMTSKEVAEYLRIHQATLSKLVRRGEIPGFKIGRDYRFRRDQIDKWMAEKSGLQEISK